MQSVTIQTSQNVEIEYEVAGVGDRVIATLIDVLLLSAYAIFLVFISSRFGDVINENFGLTITIVLYSPILFYHLVCELFMNGQSFGKRIRKIKVVKLDGSQPTFSSFFLRWLFRIIDFSLTWGSVALVTILINGKGQRLGDLAAGTTVIKLKPRTKLEDTIFAHTEDDYTPVFPKAVELNDKIITTIQEVLNLVLENDRHAIKKRRLLLKSKVMVEKKLSIHSDLSPRVFLTTIVKDYNYLKGNL